MEEQNETTLQPKNKPFKPAYSYLGQLGILLGFTGVGFILAALVQVGIGYSMIDKNVPMDKWADAIVTAMMKPENIQLTRWMQIISAATMFLLPMLFTALIISKKSLAYMGFNKVGSINQVFIVIGISLLAIVLSGVLGELNSKIPIPKNWEIAFKKMEEAYNSQVLQMARMNNFSEYLFVMVVIALAPAIFEEICFRSGLQQTLINWTKQPILAIVITSILFSAIHFSYYGFLPRVALGLLLGLLYYYSKNIWFSILMHFLNNGISVSVLYFTSVNGKPKQEVLDSNMGIDVSFTITALVGLAILTALTYLMQNFKASSEKLPTIEPINYLRKNNNPFE